MAPRLKALSKEAGARYANARELFEALTQAVPQAFQPGFQSEVACYLEELVGDRSAESNARLRVAQRELDAAAKKPAAASPDSSRVSVASLRALVIDVRATAAQALSATQTHVTLASGGVDELRPHRSASDRARFKWLLSAIVVLAVAGSFGAHATLRGGTPRAAHAAGNRRSSRKATACAYADRRVPNAQPQAQARCRFDRASRGGESACREGAWNGAARQIPCGSEGAAGSDPRARECDRTEREA